MLSILVIGAKNAGKTSFIDFLRTSCALPPEKLHHSHAVPHTDKSSGSFTSHYVETDFDGERVGLTIWDSQGMEKTIVDLQLREMTAFIESKFEETFAEEQKVQRTPGSKDTHIHCVFLLLDPGRLELNFHSHTNGYLNSTTSPAGLDPELDLQVMKAMSGKTTVIPVISKADTLTQAHMAFLKRKVWDNIQKEKLDPLDALDLEASEDESEEDSEDQDTSDSDALPIQSPSAMPGSFAGDDEDDSGDFTDPYPSSPYAKTASSATTPSPAGIIKQRSHSRNASRTLGDEADPEEIYLPYALISPDPYDPKTIGRKFAWGVADPYNETHCDFVRLKESVFSEWRTELRSASREKWYENWRTSRLKRTPQSVRQRGGVTPSTMIPREGRRSSGGRKISSAAPPQTAISENFDEYASGQAEHRPSTSRRVMGSPAVGAGAF